jgi:hypothetical protein
MGYDCTLHVVDARMIREKFVPRLLGQTGGTAAARRDLFPDEQTFIRIDKDILVELDPRTVRTFRWMPTVESLIFATPSALWAAPIDPLLSQQKYSCLTGRKIKSA